MGADLLDPMYAELESLKGGGHCQVTHDRSRVMVEEKGSE